MSDQTAGIRVSLDVIDELALPAISQAQLEKAISSWQISHYPAIDLQRMLAGANLEAADVAIAELVTESAGLGAIEAAFTDGQLAPLDLVTAVRVFIAEGASIQPLPIVCIGSASKSKPHTAPMIQQLHCTTVLLTRLWLHDDKERPDLGWTDHCLVPARHLRSQCRPSAK